MDTLLEVVEKAAAQYEDQSVLGIRQDDGATTHWSFRTLLRRSRAAAWRLRALGLQPGDRILTWAPSTPELAATYFGAMQARLIFVPLDLGMSSDAIHVIAEKSGASRLIVGTPPCQARGRRGSCRRRCPSANRRLGIHQRVVAWRPWPQETFPQTHTLKVKRNEVRAWVRGERGAWAGSREAGAAAGVPGAG